VNCGEQARQLRFTNSAATRKYTMMGQKYFKEGGTNELLKGAKID